MSGSEDALDYYRDQLRVLVWSGFFNEDDLELYCGDLTYDKDSATHVDVLREYGNALMAKKRVAEAGWPARTDWDKLDEVFAALETCDILSLHNVGYTTSDAHDDAWQTIREASDREYRGFVYYHGQDVERAVDAMPLFLGYDSIAEGEKAKRELGEEIVAAVREGGFAVDWSGDPETRMSIVDLVWKKRAEWSDQGSESETTEASDAKASGFFRRLFGR
ncbi:DUF6891 domain-containing protein [Aurantiacibacter aquimixticola]|uniref:DUF6891 domain-containing protein n=1 Tax=Aurantiacibacter aquimixticola TaxID=1958945 RepID=A0A419RU08_9SPHN|nr:hypothetical protein [Aurantiacibacter aquimixticola]RJY09271.1 hypothetical protein D6201_07800 [Aurantiacibacter aquimixticola]